MRLRVVISILLLVVLVVCSAVLTGHAGYGYFLFLLLPCAVGAAAVGMFPPADAWQAQLLGLKANALALLLFLLIGAEGLICILMAAPLALPLGALGGWLMYRAQKPKLTAGTMMLLMPVTLLWDLHAKPPVFKVATSMEVSAPPQAVWKGIVAVSELSEPHEWIFRAGIAYPKRSGIIGTGIGATRYCDFSTGPFVEPVVAWDEPRLLRFDVTKNPPPMHEWSPYHIQPKHLDGYMVSKQGEFRLRLLPNNHTLVEATTWYSHGLWPAEYWRLWSDAIIHRIHLRVLSHIREVAENRATK